MERIQQEVVLTGDAPDGWERQPGVRRRFRFELWWKNIELGSLPLRQYWMERAAIYPDRGRIDSACNFRELLDFFWSTCCGAGQQNSPGVQDIYVLANVLPYARSVGSRRVVRDAVLTLKPDERRRYLADLESMLANSRSKEMEPLTFYNQTADSLGVAKYSDEMRQRYQEMTSEFFQEAREELTRRGTAGLAVPLARWNHWVTTIGRRRGNSAAKEILDIISYESRAAFHRCYSTVWRQLIPGLVQQYGLTDAEHRFHRIWHFEFVPPAGPNEHDPGLFHGQVFALHPGSGWFLATPTGRRLMADSITAPDENPPFCRLLHGLAVAIIHYGMAAATKRPPARERTVDDPAAIGDQQTLNRRGRQRRKPASDAD